MTQNLLLVSNSKVYGGAVLDHAKDEIKDVLGDRRVVTFIPYANPGGMGYDAYTAILRPTFQAMGYELLMIRFKSDLEGAEAVFVGGGNTFELLKQLRQREYFGPLQRLVRRGVPYIGSSAGSNVAGLTIGNTNDMPSSDPNGLRALGLVPFNVNPHYAEKVVLSPEDERAVLAIAPQLEALLHHQGETRDDRIKEYHAFGNPEMVVALREGAMLRIVDGSVTLKGSTGAKIFKPNEQPVEYQPSASLDFLLKDLK